MRGLDRGAVAAGTFFVLTGLALLLDALGVWELTGGVLFPLLLVLAGVATLAGGLAGGRRGGR
jgi:hypothetical protein